MNENIVWHKYEIWLSNPKKIVFQNLYVRIDRIFHLFKLEIFISFILGYYLPIFNANNDCEP